MTWQEIADELVQRIESGELAPGTRLEGEKQLAARLDVPLHTAHRAMQELQHRALVVRQRRWGTVVAERTAEVQRTVAYVVDFAANSFQANILAHLEQALAPGTKLVVATSKNDPEREAEHILRLSREVDGIVCYPADRDGANAATFLRLASDGYPLVLIDRAPPGCEELVVLTDNVEASRDAVESLVARGHERIAFFSSNNIEVQSIQERYRGYREAIADLGYESRPYERWIALSPDGYDDSLIRSVSDALAVMRHLTEPPTAAFCTREWLALSVLDACGDLDIEVGIDFGLATFNESGAPFFRHPRRLDRIVQKMEDISATAVSRLEALMRGEALPAGPVRVPARFFPAADTPDLLSSSLADRAGTRSNVIRSHQ